MLFGEAVGGLAQTGKMHAAKTRDQHADNDHGSKATAE